jgi:hypothetical protein
LILTLFLQTAHSQWHGLGAEVYAQGDIGSTDRSNSAFFNNPAGLSGIDSNYFKAHYLVHAAVEGFQTLGLNYAKKLRSTHFSVGAQRFGFEKYAENQIGLAVAWQSDRVSIGLRSSVMNQFVKSWSSSSSWINDFGIQIQHNNRWLSGLWVRNFTKGLNNNALVLPYFIAYGLHFQATKKISLSSQIESGLEKDFMYRLGIKYALNNKIHLMTGINPKLTAQYFGLSLIQNNFRLELASKISPYSGFNSQFSFSKLW